MFLPLHLTPAPPSHFYRPTPIIYAPDAQTTSICHTARAMPHYIRPTLYNQEIVQIHTAISILQRHSSHPSHHLAANNLFPDYQSGFRRFHSILRVLSDIYSAIDQDQVSLLALLDVSAAFDTVDHSILLERLSTSYRLSGMAFTWLESYITGRVQAIYVGGRQSTPATVYFGVPQCSVLGPVLYVLYTADIVKLVESFGLQARLLIRESYEIFRKSAK